jgi:hypothetical protein
MASGTRLIRNNSMRNDDLRGVGGRAVVAGEVVPRLGQLFANLADAARKFWTFFLAARNFLARACVRLAIGGSATSSRNMLRHAGPGNILKGTMKMMKMIVGSLAIAGVTAAVVLIPARGQNRGVAGAAEAANAGKAVANPLYSAWKGQQGKTVTFDRSVQISGGAPMRGVQRKPISSQIQFALFEYTAEQALIKVTTLPAAGGAEKTLTISAKLMADDPAFPKEAGTQDLHIGEKTYACKKYTYSTDSEAEMGRSGQGFRGRVTVWVAEGIPGGVVKREISLTIRASYQITDILSP